MAKELNIQEASICASTIQMLEKAKRDGVTTCYDRANDMSACPIGEKSACCKNCSMGPCRMSPKDPYSKVGVCGATIDTIQARNFARMVVSGAAAHTDHGMAMLDLFKEVVHGKITDYTIKDVSKLKYVCSEIGIATTVEEDGVAKDRDVKEMALELAEELERTYTQVEGEIPFMKRVPAKTLERWRELGIVPRGAMRELMEMMHRTHIGVDQHYENIAKQFQRTALSDGWGGSMVATEISDILYGTPKAQQAYVDMGNLEEGAVNIIVHGHEPNLFESMIDAVNDPKNIEKAKAAGATGIVLGGMCCSGAEVLMRHGVPHLGDFLSTEAVIVTGAVDAMAVDVQCIKQALAPLSECYGTKFITTNPRAHIEGAIHVELKEDKPRECVDKVVEMAIERYKNRTKPVEIPQNKQISITGISHEYVNYVLGGRFRSSYVPLNDNIINGRIRGVAGVVGCTNPRVKHDWVHVEVVKELIKNNVLVVQTGCSAIALAKTGLLTPEAAKFCGDGLAEVCETTGLPPVLNLGSCVDNSRILIACAEMVKTGGLGDKISDLPVAGSAPEWMSEKAISIGQYFVSSGVYTVFGATFPVTDGTKFKELLFNGLEAQVGGMWDFAKDPYEHAQKMIDHIDKKREALGIQEKQERKLFDMADRRAL
ncbi:MAG: anaerobic carbon-monoxide dehydrogenase catalytic subunit [Deltaproteobacteria bacterium]|nr:anaerobic carbon-monoxide dehydrogenase catalytic subunit [Candidatus Anaeroferrophillus wilburensis]MBN2889350.1 anaerobic carbon-monoxide dehydrogenase catalytic subunit [Deltaproteobacteria bacterium]